MKVALLKETVAGERRVALVPGNIAALTKAGLEVLVQAGAGEAAGFTDAAYAGKGAKVAATASEACAADILVQVRVIDSRGNLTLENADYRRGQIVIGLADPLGQPQAIKLLAERGVSLLALELIPRSTRAQSMDVLSSMATLAGYRAVLLAGVELPKMFPLMMTAAGTLTAAKVFVLGAGVAGLQAMATAKRLGAVVRGYDVRPACKEQVESVGAKFVELALETTDAQDAGGYAKAQDEAFYQRQRELLGKIVAESDVVITTAAIPGKQSPLLVTAEAVTAMQPGSVIVDLAAERGGNCALTKADARVIAHGVTILGPTNLPADVPLHASQMFGGNVTALLKLLVVGGQLVLNREDDIIRETLVTHDGQVVHPRLVGQAGAST
jgi:H+-translocating NAD(P) transhydrogenase subunit alpha